MHQSELAAQSTYSSVQQERELGPGVAGVATEEPPCSMMIQGGSFYSYSAATAAAAAAASRRLSTAVVEGGGGPSSSSVTSTGIQVLPRERHVKPGTYPPSPGSGDSAEYEQPIIGHLRAADISPPPLISSPLHHHHLHHHHDDIFAQPSTSSRSATKMLQCPPDVAEGMDELSEAEFEEVVVNAELIYGRNIGPTATCRVHGPCNQQQQQQLPPLLPESAPSMTSLLDIEPVGPSQFQFNEITWGRCSRTGGYADRERARFS